MVKRIVLMVAVIVTWRVHLMRKIPCPPVDPWSGESNAARIKSEVLEGLCWENYRKWMSKEFPTRREALQFIETRPSNVDSIRIDGYLVGKEKK